MRILALDTSQTQATICLLEGGELKSSKTGSTSVAHSEALLPLIDTVLAEGHVWLTDLDALAVGIGPGSFTGLRIGCATMKALAQVLGKPILPFSSLRALAESVDGTPSTQVVAMANAYQGQVFLGAFRDAVWFEDVVTPGDWVADHLEWAGEHMYCGSGAHAFWAKLQAQIGSAAHLSPVSQIHPKGILRAVGAQQVKGSVAFVNYLELRANYIRPSQAEIKRDEYDQSRSLQKSK